MAGICRKGCGIARADKGLGSPALPKSGEDLEPDGRGPVTCCPRSPRTLCFPVGRKLCKVEKGSETFAKVIWGMSGA